MFTHDANHKITIGTFKATYDNFRLLEPAYQLPDGVLWQYYVPGVQRILGHGIYQRDDGPVWTDGDSYLANEALYAVLQPDTTPNVPGFEVALLGLFGGDYITVNSLYSGWPLLKDTMENHIWSQTSILFGDAFDH